MSPSHSSKGSQIRQVIYTTLRATLTVPHLGSRRLRLVEALHSEGEHRHLAAQHLESQPLANRRSGSLRLARRHSRRRPLGRPINQGNRHLVSQLKRPLPVYYQNSSMSGL